ncbi:hypothetical protein T484DRAFT_1874246, partial [Baffinella frigidus]
MAGAGDEGRGAGGGDVGATPSRPRPAAPAAGVVQQAAADPSTMPQAGATPGMSPPGSAASLQERPAPGGAPPAPGMSPSGAAAPRPASGSSRAGLPTPRAQTPPATPPIQKAAPPQQQASAAASIAEGLAGAKTVVDDSNGGETEQAKVASEEQVVGGWKVAKGSVGDGSEPGNGGAQGGTVRESAATVQKGSVAPARVVTPLQGGGGETAETVPAPLQGGGQKNEETKAAPLQAAASSVPAPERVPAAGGAQDAGPPAPNAGPPPPVRVEVARTPAPTAATPAVGAPIPTAGPPPVKGAVGQLLTMGPTYVEPIVSYISVAPLRAARSWGGGAGGGAVEGARGEAAYAGGEGGSSPA